MGEILVDEIRELTETDFEDILQLSEFAFQYTTTEEEAANEKVEVKRHTIWGYTVDGQVAGKVHVVPFEALIKGIPFKMGGIGAVATWPEYRRSGIAKKLMYRSLEDMRDKGQTISFLHPFHVGFYRKLGWELIATRRHYKIPTESLRRKWQGEGYVRRIARDLPLLNKIYEKYAEQYNGMLLRDDYWWENKILADKEMDISVAYNEAGEAEGYIIYKVRNSVLSIKDIAYINQNARNILFEFISNHDSMAPNVEMVAADNDLLPYILDNPRFENKSHPYFMGRIVDVENFFKQYPFTYEKNIVTIEVADTFFPENKGTYKLRLEDGKAEVTKTTEKVEGAIQCDITHLTSLFFGYRRPTELWQAGLISGSDVEIASLEKVIPHAQTYLADFF